MGFRKSMLLLITMIILAHCKTPETNDSESHFYSFDKIKIAYSDEGSGKAVILIHGFIVNGSSWNKTVLKKSLLDNGYRVIIPDLRGNGLSDKPSEAVAYQDNAEIKDIIALANHLQLKSYMAVGYSRGSIVLAKLLTKEERISKAVFGGMGIDFTNSDWDRRIAFADAFSGRAEPDEMTKGAIDYAKSIHADIRALGFLQDYQPVTSLTELAKIKIETLVICGDQDKDNGNPEDLDKQLPNSKLIIVNGDHNNTYKQEDFAAAIMSFLMDK